jgi:hypothetical protein
LLAALPQQRPRAKQLRPKAAGAGVLTEPLPLAGWLALLLTQVVQLYETTAVRHGLMLVGPTMSGKTCCYRVLQVSAAQAAKQPRQQQPMQTLHSSLTTAFQSAATNKRPQ